MFLLRAVVVWFILIGVEVIHDALRTIFLSPSLGDFRVRQVSVFMGSLLIVSIAYLFVRWIRAHTTRALVVVGLAWLTLTVVFEIGFGHFVLSRPWDGVASDFNILQGGLLPIGLVVLTLSPLIAARLRGLTKRG